MDIIGDFLASRALLPALLLASAMAACAAGGGSGTPDAHDDLNDSTEGVTEPVDDGPGECTTNADCNDSIDCTEDQCTVDRVCQHTAIDSRCPEGTHCHLTEGCVEGCEEDADCDNGLWCDGDEVCRTWGCEPAMGGRDCSDGNECTEDICDEERDVCTYETYPECLPDAMDASGEPFDPAVHFDGRFSIFPRVSQACAPYLSYDFGRLTFSTAGGTLTVTGGPFTLTQSPVPSDGNFSVVGVHSCMTVTLSGSFSDADTFTGRWLGVTSGCDLCTSQDIDPIVGVRE